MSKILMIGRQGGSAAHLAAALGEDSFTFEYVTGETAAFGSVAASEPSLIALEIAPSDGQALALCKRIRQLFDVPVVACSGSGREQDVVRALEAGADDYFVMPMRPAELSARIRAVLRRSGVSGGTVTENHLVAGDVEMLTDEHKAFRRGEPLDLSPIEFKLLALLVRESGRAVGHSRLLAHVWGPEYVDCRHYLRLYVRYLRAKVEDNPDEPELILNDWGVGYRFEPNAEAPV